jgi:NAD(P)H-dependent FMN reductase
MASPRVLILCGGSSKGSRTHAALHTVAAILEEGGAAVHWSCVHGRVLPPLDPEQRRPAEADDLRREADEADAFIVGSPEYHGAFSGSLKNMIDYLSRRQVGGKPVGLLAASGGAKGGINTLNMLRLVFRALHAPALVDQAAVSESDFDEQGHLSDTPSAAHVRTLGLAMLQELGLAAPTDGD